ncbi:hypothetical protein WMF04_23900 [Sorangium sp. So ce260]|uniref:hypothetical protein n=1 Tax=Sorangium sp. So ce260 TaxID=3133291 RepID=UPI003F5F8AAE
MSETEKQSKSRHTVEPTSLVPEHFFDGIANISLTGGVVRIDLAHLSATARDEEGQPRLERNVRLITSIEGFVAAYQTMQRMVEKLAAQGKLAVAPPPSAAALSSGPRTP